MRYQGKGLPTVMGTAFGGPRGKYMGGMSAPKAPAAAKGEAKGEAKG